MAYTFQAVKNMENIIGSSKLCKFIYNGEQFSLIYGKIKALFGQPIYETEDLDDLFSYCILATSEEMEEVYLSIYCAGSGLAVGGMQDEKSREAAKALVDYVMQAEPINYAYKAYYFDGPTVLEFGIKDGTPYYNETEISSPEEYFSGKEIIF